MSIEVEDGTGRTNADAYISVVFADAYHTSRGNTKWTDASNSVLIREQAIVRATDHIDQMFGRKFLGTKDREFQALEWPRINAIVEGWFLDRVVPPQLQKACAEYALRAILNNVLSPDPVAPVASQTMVFGEENGSQVGTGEIKREKVIVGPVEVDTTYNTMSEVQSSTFSNRSKSGLVTDSLLPQYPAADLWIEELLKPGSVRLLKRA